MKVIGITGGVGSGKSALLSYIGAHYRCRIILSDEAGHEVMQPGGSVYEPLIRLLEQYPADTAIAGSQNNGAGQGSGLLNADGTINRGEMAARIFAHPDLRQKVNGLIHPAVRAYILDAIARERQKGSLDYFFIEAALLIECGYGAVVDEMWYIYCRPGVRRERLRSSRGYSEEKIDAIMKSQLSEEEFRKNCDVVIDNSGSYADACRQVDAHLAAPVS